MDVNGDKDDGPLLASIAAGDRKALDVLYRRHHKRVFCFIRRYESNIATAEDLANDVFIEAWKQAGRFEGRSKVSSWLLGIARFKALSERRKRRAIVDPDDALGEVADHADTPDVTAQKTSKAAVLRQCISRLPEDHRVIVDLVYYHECPIKDAAAILDIPENTVKTRMFHARKKLSAMMADAGLDRGWP